MTITVYDIISATSVFNKILSYEFTGKQSFIISRILRSLNDEIENFNTTKETLLKKYAKTDNNGKIIFDNKNVVIKEEYQDKFWKEINEILYTTLEVNLQKIPIEWLDEIKLTPQEIFVLEPFLEV